MNIPAEYSAAIVGAVCLMIGLALDWWSDRQFERKHGKIDRNE